VAAAARRVLLDRGGAYDHAVIPAWDKDGRRRRDGSGVDFPASTGVRGEWGQCEGTRGD